MSYLCYLCLFGYGGIQHIVLCFCFVCLRLLYPMLPVSHCSFLIATSIFFVYSLTGVGKKMRHESSIWVQLK